MTRSRTRLAASRFSRTSALVGVVCAVVGSGCARTDAPTTAPASSNSDAAAYVYTPTNQQLHDEIVEIDRKFFHAYNTCDLATSAAMISDDIEFFHDGATGYTTSKQEILDATERNICGKVQRTIVDGSIEVYPVAGYGAVQLGMHTFRNNQEPDAPPRPMKFVHVWRQHDGQWKLTRVISLH